MAKQRVQCETSDESSMEFVHAALKKVPSWKNLGGRSRGQSSTIGGLAVRSHGAYGEDWEGAIFSMPPRTMPLEPSS